MSASSSKTDSSKNSSGKKSSERPLLEKIPLERTTSTAVFPGSFDPVTNGHLDVIERALGIFPELTVAVAQSTTKTTLFSGEERTELMRQACVRWGTRVRVTPFSGLLVRYMEETGLSIIVRGLRAVADFEYEVQMAQMNRSLSARVDTIFLPAGERSSFVSSSFIKQVATLGGDVSNFVPPEVSQALKRVGQPR